jgi:DNA-binding NarL/FixJ family response regulator
VHGITLLSHTNEYTLIARALQAGAAAVLPPTATWTEIEPQLRVVAAGKYPINDRILDDPDLAQEVFAQVRQGSDVGMVCPLSVQELRVLDLIANGKSTKNVARQLAISEYTVKEYVANILRKLDVPDRLQVVVAAIKHG